MCQVNTGWKEIYVMISIASDMSMYTNIAKCIGAFEYLGNEVLYDVPLTALKAHGRPSQHLLDVAPFAGCRGMRASVHQQ